MATDQMDFEQLSSLAWPWTLALRRKLLAIRQDSLHGSHILFGSDYSGDHRGSPYNVYGFIVADAEASPEWPAMIRDVRRSFLPDGRRMSFKNLNDSHRRRALIPFLEATESFSGQVVVIAVSKRFKHLSASASAMELWNQRYGLQAKWDLRKFEQMLRVAHFFSLCIAAWSSPGANISWITDDDDIVANDRRLNDMHQLAARLSGLYVSHDLGEFMLNTASVDGKERYFEDFLAVPDLAAGMIAEILSAPARYEPAEAHMLREKDLTPKSDVISDWFWYRGGSLKKGCILIDYTEDRKPSVSELQMLDIS